MQAVFNADSWEQMKAYQGDLIRLFKEFTNKLLVLHGQREADAIPVMAIIVEFMEKWLHVGYILRFRASTLSNSSELCQNSPTT